ncbi:MAG: hypothetical protein ABII74_07540 [Elusimicrobiota bacterium]
MSKLKEKANPAREFKHDPLMRELHETRLKMFEETKNKSIKDKIEMIKEKAAKFRKQ